MKKGLRFLTCLLFFLPAITATLLSCWVFVYPFSSIPQQIDLPLSILFFLLTLWCSGILLSFGKCWGGVIAIVFPVLDLLSSMSGYSGHHHLSPLPLLGLMAVYSLVCAGLCCRNKQKNQR